MNTRIILIALACAVALLAVGCAKTSATSTKTAEALVDSMAKGDFAGATKDFDATMKTAMPAEKLGQVWSQVAAQAGAFKSRTGSREAQEGGYQTIYVTCQFEKANLNVKVVFNGSGQVSGLWIVPA